MVTITFLATICAILAVVFFFWSSVRKVAWIDQTAFGLFWLTLAMIFSGLLKLMF